MAAGKASITSEVAHLPVFLGLGPKSNPGESRLIMLARILPPRSIRRRRWFMMRLAGGCTKTTARYLGATRTSIIAGCHLVTCVDVV
jgi:hypothetical protein